MWHFLVIGTSVLADTTSPATQGASDAASTARIAIIVAVLTVLGTILAAVIGPAAQDLMGKSKWRREQATDMQVQRDEDAIRKNMTEVANTLVIQGKADEEWRNLHSVTDRELDRRFAALEANVESLREKHDKDLAQVNIALNETSRRLDELKNKKDP